MYDDRSLNPHGMSPNPLLPLFQVRRAAALLCLATLPPATAAPAVAQELPAQDPPQAVPATPPAAPDGSLSGYWAAARYGNHELRAARELWRAAALDQTRAKRWPEPVLSYDGFLSSVETRVGPQRHHLGLSQQLPWPGKLQALADAAAATTRAARNAYQARLWEVRRRVADVYWRLWLVAKEHRLRSEHDLVLENLAGTVRGRVQIGDASLADLNQVELRISRHHDHHGRHHQQLQAAAAELRALIGYDVGYDADLAAPLPVITGMPPEGLLADPEAELRAAARAHPGVRRHALLARAARHLARSEATDRLPSLRVGLDFIEIGPAATAGLEDSGRDALSLSAAVSIPLWRHAYDAAEAADRARSAAHQAEYQAQLWQAEARLEAALARLRDSQRRIALCRNTLIPQAETTFHAVLGGYQAGRSTIAAALLAQQDLLEIQLGLVRARTEHARGWAQLEQVVGRPLRARRAP